MSELAALMCRRGVQTLDSGSRRLLTLVAEAEQILADELVFIPLYQHPDAGVVWADELAGYQPQPGTVERHLEHRHLAPHRRVNFAAVLATCGAWHRLPGSDSTP